MRTHYFIYPKDEKGKRTGHCICVMAMPEGVFHGMALCSKKDNFNFKVGRELATDRALAAYQNHLNKVVNK